MDALYSKALMRLAADATGSGRLDPADGTAVTASAMCGDRIQMDLRLNGPSISAIGHETKACVLTQASTSLLASVAVGLTADQIAMGETMLLTWFSGGKAPTAPFDAWIVFDALREHPARQACVLLPFKSAAQAFRAAGR